MTKGCDRMSRWTDGGKGDERGGGVGLSPTRGGDYIDKGVADFNAIVL